MQIKRVVDFILSLIGILALLPLWACIALLIKSTSKGPIFFTQTRVTKGERLFQIYKFRTMKDNTEGDALLTIGDDCRITAVGSFLRKTKLDELPQLINVLKGDMSFVGPRPQVPKYVALYTEEQKEVLQVRTGITDYASIYFYNESDLLGKADDPERFYIEEIMPYKIELNKKYIREMGFVTDMKIIALTVAKVMGHGKGHKTKFD